MRDHTVTAVGVPARERHGVRAGTVVEADLVNENLGVGWAEWSGKTATTRIPTDKQAHVYPSIVSPTDLARKRPGARHRRPCPGRRRCLLPRLLLLRLLLELAQEAGGLLEVLCSKGEGLAGLQVESEGN